jgi:hypothetical protein
MLPALLIVVIETSPPLPGKFAIYDPVISPSRHGSSPAAPHNSRCARIAKRIREFLTPDGARYAPLPVQILI